MKFEKGQKVECIKDCFEQGSGKSIFIGGLKYDTIDDDCIIDELNEARWWDVNSAIFKEYFVLCDNDQTYTRTELIQKLKQLKELCISAKMSGELIGEINVEDII